MAQSAISPAAVVTLIGLGQMGLPMARRLIEAGYKVRGADPAEPARAALVASGGQAFASTKDAVDGAAVVITMLPTGKIVRDVLLGADKLAQGLPKSTLIIDMSSSAPMDTTSLAEDLTAVGLTLLDAPVSGGVKRAIDGSLAIMVGGPADAVERVRPVLAAMGKSIIPTGRVGSGHAMKALNNYVSAAGLIAACEALLIGRTFGLAPDTIVDVLNVSTGRNNSTDVKMKPFVITEKFNSGFSFALMAKDLRIAADLSKHLGLTVPQVGAVADLWEKAKGRLSADADHTEIYRFLADLDVNR